MCWIKKYDHLENNVKCRALILHVSEVRSVKIKKIGIEPLLTQYEFKIHIAQHSYIYITEFCCQTKY